MNNPPISYDEATIRALEEENTELLAENKKLKAELERWQKIDKRCDTYWLAGDPEFGGCDWYEIVEGCALRHGDIVEVWRGGTVEKAWCGHVGETFIKEPTREAAEAKAKELLAVFREDEDD